MATPNEIPNALVAAGLTGWGDLDSDEDKELLNWAGHDSLEQAHDKSEGEEYTAEMYEETFKQSRELEEFFTQMCYYVDQDTPDVLGRWLSNQSKEFLEKVMALCPYKNWGGTILHYACRWRHPKDCGCARSSDGDEVIGCGLILPKSGKSKRVEVVKILLKYGANKSAKDAYGCTAHENCNNRDLLFSNPCYECLDEMLLLLAVD